jgi:hypothetical protein
VSDTLAKVLSFVAAGRYFVSRHALDEGEEDAIPLLDLLSSMPKAVVVEDYPDAKRGPSFLCLLSLSDESVVHAVWGIPNLAPDRAGLVTVYRPKLQLWSPDFMKRIPK